METDLRTMGLNHAVIRTLICMVLLFFPFAGAGFSYSGATGVSWDASFRDMILAGVVALFIFLIIVFNWMLALKGGPLCNIKEFCAQSDDPKAMMMLLEKIWDGDVLQNQNCRVDDQYLIWARKMNSIVIPLKDIFGVRYVTSVSWTSGDLYIYLKDNTFVALRLREKQGRSIEEYIQQNMAEIVTGEPADSQLLETLVGKINTRHKIVKIQRRYFIVDYSSPSKLSSYLSFGEKYRFGTKGFWNAWEIPEEELQSINYKPYEATKTTFDSTKNIKFGFAVIVAAFLINHPVFEVFPIRSLFEGRYWLLLFIVAGLFLVYFIFLNITSNFKTEKYSAVRISRKKSPYIKHLLRQYIFLRISLLCVLLYFIIMMFIWNVGLFLYVLYIAGLFSYIFIGVWTGRPNIDPQCTIEKVEK